MYLKLFDEVDLTLTKAKFRPISVKSSDKNSLINTYKSNLTAHPKDGTR